jgi:hypothetical protein
MAVAAFWIAVAAFIIVGALNARRGYELKHETIRLMLEKGQKIDDALFKELIAPPKWHTPSNQPVGEGYTVMRVMGTMALFAAPGVALLIFLTGHARGNIEQQAAGIGVGIMVALIGIGLHVACRFVTPPQRRSGLQ